MRFISMEGGKIKSFTDETFAKTLDLQKECLSLSAPYIKFTDLAKVHLRPKLMKLSATTFLVTLILPTSVNLREQKPPLKILTYGTLHKEASTRHNLAKVAPFLSQSSNALYLHELCLICKRDD